MKHLILNQPKVKTGKGFRKYLKQKQNENKYNKTHGMQRRKKQKEDLRVVKLYNKDEETQVN